MRKSLPPIFAPNARILILGTIPGEQSLTRQEYYANPRNQFWDLMQVLFNISRNAPYADRISQLLNHHIVLWDVLHSCERVGSSDSAIKNPIPNDFGTFLGSTPDLQLIAFNGDKAAKWFTRWVKIDTTRIRMLTLPSTSPARAMALERKLAYWAVLKNI